MTQFTSNYLRSNRLWTWSLFLKDINTMVWGSMKNDLEPQGLGANPPSMVPQIAELVHVCLSKINWYISWSCVVPGFSSYSFYIMLPHFLEMNALNPTGGAAPLPQIRHKTRFSEQKKLAPKDARGKAVERHGFGVWAFLVWMSF